MDKPLFAPSLMCMDITHTLETLETLNRHCGLYHVDIMDGHFVPNITLSPDFVRAVRAGAKLPIDAHLMVTDPALYLPALAAAGADYITVHLEAVGTNAYRTLQAIRRLGCKPGLCLCPATPAEWARPLLAEVDLLTVMTVDPGYAGQPFIPQMVEKVARLAEMRAEGGHSFVIQCDGAIGPATYGPLYGAGARAFVMGTSGLFFPTGSLEENCLRMKTAFTTATGVAV